MIGEYGKLEPGDLYDRMPCSCGWVLAQGGITDSYEFGKYQVIVWDEYPPGYGKSDVMHDLFRVSDGPNELVGMVSEIPDDGEYLATINRGGLLTKGQEYFKNLLEAIEFLVDFSEKELEEHFNSVFARG